jgi:hypothetical protein
MDLWHAAERHPVSNLIERLNNFLPNMKLPFQYPLPARRKKVSATLQPHLKSTAHAGLRPLRQIEFFLLQSLRQWRIIKVWK